MAFEKGEQGGAAAAQLVDQRLALWVRTLGHQRGDQLGGQLEVAQLKGGLCHLTPKARQAVTGGHLHGGLLRQLEPLIGLKRHLKGALIQAHCRAERPLFIS